MVQAQQIAVVCMLAARELAPLASCVSRKLCLKQGKMLADHPDAATGNLSNLPYMHGQETSHLLGFPSTCPSRCRGPCSSLQSSAHDVQKGEMCAHMCDTQIFNRWIANTRLHQMLMSLSFPCSCNNGDCTSFVDGRSLSFQEDWTHCVLCTLLTCGVMAAGL